MKRVGFKWGSDPIRVFRVGSIAYSYQENVDEYRLVTRKRKRILIDVDYQFSIAISDSSQQDNASGSIGIQNGVSITNIDQAPVTTLSDILNALNDPAIDVEFYPVLDTGTGQTGSVDITTKYVVINASTRNNVISARRAGFINSFANIVVATETPLDNHPSFINR